MHMQYILEQISLGAFRATRDQPHDSHEANIGKCDYLSCFVMCKYGDDPHLLIFLHLASAFDAFHLFAVEGWDGLPPLFITIVGITGLYRMGIRCLQPK